MLQSEKSQRGRTDYLLARSNGCRKLRRNRGTICLSGQGKQESISNQVRMRRMKLRQRLLAFVASDGRKGHVLDWVVLVPDALDG